MSIFLAFQRRALCRFAAEGHGSCTLYQCDESVALYADLAAAVARRLHCGGEERETSRSHGRFEGLRFVITMQFISYAHENVSMLFDLVYFDPMYVVVDLAFSYPARFPVRAM